MDDLIARIRAAIEEDERTALAASKITPAGWSVEPWEPSEPGAVPAVAWVVAGPDGDDGVAQVCGSFVADHIARYDPARVLRQVAAHRKILDEHPLTVSKHEQLPYDPVSGERIPDSWDVECARCGWCSSDPASACPTVLALADAYGIES